MCQQRRLQLSNTNLFVHGAQSKKGAELIWKHPILLDACANEMQRKGDAMMSKWAEVMTNMRPKTYFLRPDVALPLGIAVVRELWNQKILGRPSMYVKR
jgi:hypothetical protein